MARIPGSPVGLPTGSTKGTLRSHRVPLQKPQGTASGCSRGRSPEATRHRLKAVPATTKNGGPTPFLVVVRGTGSLREAPSARPCRFLWSLHTVCPLHCLSRGSAPDPGRGRAPCTRMIASGDNHAKQPLIAYQTHSPPFPTISGTRKGKGSACGLRQPRKRGSLARARLHRGCGGSGGLMGVAPGPRSGLYTKCSW